MKNLKIFALAAFALLGFAACQQEELVPQKTTHTVTFVAGAPETTKTTVAIEGTTAKFAWTAEDAGRFTVYENGEAATRVEAGITDGVMSMLAEFSGNVPSSPKYQALFNSEVSATQIVPENSYAETTDVMVSEVLDGSKRDDEFVFRFKREVAFAKMTLKGLTSGAYVSSVKIESDKPIAGKYDLKTGTFIETSNVITLDVLNNVVEGNATVWFTTIPVEDANFTVTATTVDSELNDAATYTKTFAKTISLTRGDVKPFSVAMTKALPSVKTFSLVTSSPADWCGEYVLVAANSSKYYAFDKTSTTENKWGVASEISIENSAIVPSSPGMVITIVKGTTEGTYSIKTNDGNYLSASAKGAFNYGTTYDKDNCDFTISLSDNGVTITQNSSTASTKRNLRYNYNSGAGGFRWYDGTTGVLASLYAESGIKYILPSPTNLIVSSETKQVTWDAVDGAASYTLTIGSDEFSCPSNLFDAKDIDDEYYDIAVVAVPSDIENYKNSDAATLTDAKFGTPTLATPTLATGAVDEFSVNATWTVDSRATEGYNCELYNGETKVGDSKTVKSGSVTFDGLDDGVTYTIKVNAKAVEGTKAYAASPVASIGLTTKGTTKISDISKTGTYTVKNAVVYAVANTGVVIIGDGTGLMLLSKSNHGYAVGDTFSTIAGTVAESNGIWQFNAPIVGTKTSGSSPDYGTAVEATSDYLASKPNKVIYVHARGSQSGRYITVGTEKLYMSKANTTNDGKDVDAYGFIYGYSTQYSNTNFCVTSIAEDPSAPKLSVNPTSKTWESVETDAAVFTVTTNTEGVKDWSISQDNLDWASVEVDTKNGTITVTPNGENAEKTANEGTITVTHAGDNSLTKTITLTQKANATGELKTWTYALSARTDPKLYENNPATVNGATWSITMGDKNGAPSTNGAPTKYSGVFGWKWGDSGSKYWSSYTLSTDYFASKSVKSVTVNFLNNGKKSATMIVKQGETIIGTATQEFGTAWTDLTAETTQGTGGTLTINYSVAQASYIHSITVEYYE